MRLVEKVNSDWISVGVRTLDEVLRSEKTDLMMPFLLFGVDCL